MPEQLAKKYLPVITELKSSSGSVVNSVTALNIEEISVAEDVSISGKDENAVFLKALPKSVTDDVKENSHVNAVKNVQSSNAEFKFVDRPLLDPNVTAAILFLSGATPSKNGL